MKYALMLNDMRHSNIENLDVVKVSSNKEELISFHDRLLVKQYRDENWDKRFRKGSELEWFNPANFDGNNYWGGIYEFDDNIPDEEIMSYKLRKGF